MKKTKIIGTISDRKCEVEFIQSLYDAGMNIVRLNTAHQTTETALKVVQNVRQVSGKIPFILDTKGPEIRTSKIKYDITVKENDTVFINCNKDRELDSNSFSVNYSEYIQDINVGNNILIDDGEISLTVIEKKKNIAKCRINNDGVIKNNKSINTPSVKIKLPGLSKKDITFINFAMENDVDFIAHSFVRNKEDVLAIQEILDRKNSKVKIIAKIENKEGVDNIDEILDHVYGIMVARGDLAIEIAHNKIPVIQKNLVTKCIKRRKPVIIATQMLHTMIDNPRPTRAEVSDIANAIYDGTDVIMLSGETAYGKYPVEAVKTMTGIAKEIESAKTDMTNIPVSIINNEISGYLAKSAVIAAKDLSTKAIIADTASGRTIRSLATYRPDNIIYAMCYDKRIMRELMMSYGVYTFYIDPIQSSDEFIKKALAKLTSLNKLQESDRVIILAGNFGQDHGASFIEISTVKNMFTKCDNGTKY